MKVLEKSLKVVVKNVYEPTKTKVLIFTKAGRHIKYNFTFNDSYIQCAQHCKCCSALGILSHNEKIIGIFNVENIDILVQICELIKEIIICIQFFIYSCLACDEVAKARHRYKFSEGSSGGVNFFKTFITFMVVIPGWLNLVVI